MITFDLLFRVCLSHLLKEIVIELLWEFGTHCLMEIWFIAFHYNIQSELQKKQ